MCVLRVFQHAHFHAFHVPFLRYQPQENQMHDRESNWESLGMTTAGVQGTGLAGGVLSWTKLNSELERGPLFKARVLK